MNNYLSITMTWAVLIVAVACWVIPAIFTPNNLTQKYDLYVDSESGSDITGDGSFEKPYRTIFRALKEVKNGGSMKIGPGYYGDLDFPDYIKSYRVDGEGCKTIFNTESCGPNSSIVIKPH